MHRDDLMQNTLRWVFGYCYLWNQQAKQFDFNSVEYTRYVHRVHTTIWRYLHGQQSLDASCSDLECTGALEARRVFGGFVNKQEN